MADPKAGEPLAPDDLQERLEALAAALKLLLVRMDVVLKNQETFARQLSQIAGKPLMERANY